MNIIFVQTFNRTFILYFQCSFEFRHHTTRINRNRHETHIYHDKVEFINNNINNRYRSNINNHCYNKNKINFQTKNNRR